LELATHYRLERLSWLETCSETVVSVPLQHANKSG
jgi:hypothetical protein